MITKVYLCVLAPFQVLARELMAQYNHQTGSSVVGAYVKNLSATISDGLRARWEQPISHSISYQLTCSPPNFLFFSLSLLIPQSLCDENIDTAH